MRIGVFDTVFRDAALAAMLDTILALRGDPAAVARRWPRAGVGTLQVAIRDVVPIT